MRRVIFTDLVVVGQAVASGFVAHRANKMKTMLNPVTSGVVVLGQP